MNEPYSNLLSHNLYFSLCLGCFSAVLGSVWPIPGRVGGEVLGDIEFGEICNQDMLYKQKNLFSLKENISIYVSYLFCLLRRVNKQLS